MCCEAEPRVSPGAVFLWYPWDISAQNGLLKYEGCAQWMCQQFLVLHTVILMSSWILVITWLITLFFHDNLFLWAVLRGLMVCKRDGCAGGAFWGGLFGFARSPGQWVCLLKANAKLLKVFVWNLCILHCDPTCLWFCIYALNGCFQVFLVWKMMPK